MLPVFTASEATPFWEPAQMTVGTRLLSVHSRVMPQSPPSLASQHLLDVELGDASLAETSACEHQRLSCASSASLFMLLASGLKCLLHEAQSQHCIAGASSSHLSWALFLVIVLRHRRTEL